MKALLIRMKEYIEEMEVKIDEEWGYGRKLEKIISDKEMNNPKLYNDVLNEIKKLEETN